MSVVPKTNTSATNKLSRPDAFIPGTHQMPLYVKDEQDSSTDLSAGYPNFNQLHEKIRLGLVDMRPRVNHHSQRFYASSRPQFYNQLSAWASIKRQNQAPFMIRWLKWTKKQIARRQQ